MTILQTSEWGALLSRFWLLLKCLLIFGSGLAVVVEFSDLCGDMPCSHWWQGRLRLCCRVESVHSPPSKLKTPRLWGGAPAQTVQHCLSDSSIHSQWWQTSLLHPLLTQERGRIWTAWLPGSQMLPPLGKATGAPWDILKFWEKLSIIHHPSGTARISRSQF